MASTLHNEDGAEIDELSLDGHWQVHGWPVWWSENMWLSSLSVYGWWRSKGRPGSGWRLGMALNAHCAGHDDLVRNTWEHVTPVCSTVKNPIRGPPSRAEGLRQKRGAQFEWHLRQPSCCPSLGRCRRPAWDRGSLVGFQEAEALTRLRLEKQGAAGRKQCFVTGWWWTWVTYSPFMTNNGQNTPLNSDK